MLLKRISLPLFMMIIVEVRSSFRLGALAGVAPGEGYSPPSERDDQFVGAHFKTICSL